MIVLARCDDRLIHGQCMTVLIQEHEIKRIVVVDDFTANNAILKTVFQAAVPPSIDGNVFTIDGSGEKINQAMTDNVRSMVLVKSPIVYRDLIAKIPALPKELNIGPMSNRKGTTPATNNSHLLPEEAQAIKDIAAQGIHVYFRQVPSQKLVEWDDVKDKF